MNAVGMLLLASTPFVFQCSIGELIFAVHFRRRERFPSWLTLAIGLELLLGTAVFALCHLSLCWVIQNTLCYLLLFLICLLLPFLCYEESPAALILCAASGYTVQHITSQFSQLLWSGQTLSTGSTDITALLTQRIVEYILFAIVTALIYTLFARNTTHVHLSPGVEHSLVLLSSGTLAIVLVLSSVRDSFAGESFALMAVSRLFSIFCCVFLLYLRSGIIEKSRMEQEREDLLRHHALEREQYEQSRENIELINIKCHDLKRRMEQWEHGPTDPKEVRQVREMIGIYDSAIKTGNDTLDVLLTERSLYCEKHGIRLSCMIDGSKLDFMPVGDVYSLFGNALENAIEAVSKLEQPEDRNISFLVRERRGMLVITVDNYFSSPLVFENGLPHTTKTGDQGYHGYGLKSIRMVAEKYGGEVTVTADDLFHLNVLIPLPEYTGR